MRARWGHICSSCGYRCLTFRALIRHIYSEHPVGSFRSCPDAEHEWVDGMPGERICVKCGFAISDHKRPIEN